MRTHGMFGTPIYGAWAAMHQRCRNPNCKAYKNYGARGITVCERWNRFESFYEDMGPTHQRGLDLDREKNELGYLPSNCRWVTRKKNLANRRHTKWVEYEGRRVPLSELCEELNLIYKSVNARLNLGWSLADSLQPTVLGVRHYQKGTK